MTERKYSESILRVKKIEHLLDTLSKYYNNLKLKKNMLSLGKYINKFILRTKISRINLRMIGIKDFYSNELSTWRSQSISDIELLDDLFESYEKESRMIYLKLSNLIKKYCND